MQYKYVMHGYVKKILLVLLVYFLKTLNVEKNFANTINLNDLELKVHTKSYTKIYFCLYIYAISHMYVQHRHNPHTQARD